MAEQRLQKVLAAAGVDSRRKCEELILAGAVRVNRKVVDELPAFADPDKDVITVNGKRIQQARKVYYLLNKPKGVICTNSDPQGRKKAIDIVRSPERIVCVGRLDADTTGIIILTNDTELVNKLTHPRYGLPKTYVVGVKGKITGAQLEKIKKGVTIRQGLNRQIRRTLAKVGLPVKSLKRTKIGKITSRGLGVGKYRNLTPNEVAHLRKIATE